MPIAVGKEEEYRELVSRERGEVGVEGQAATEDLPELPCGTLGGGAVVRDAGTRLRCESAPVTAESIMVLGVHMRQEELWG